MTTQHQQWEYFRKYLDHYKNNVAEELDAFGNEGYELISVISDGSDGAWYIFKRPKQ